VNEQRQRQRERDGMTDEEINNEVGRLACEEVTAVDIIKMHSCSPLWSRGLPSK